MTDCVDRDEASDPACVDRTMFGYVARGLLGGLVGVLEGVR